MNCFIANSFLPAFKLAIASLNVLLPVVAQPVRNSKIRAARTSILSFQTNAVDAPSVFVANVSYAAIRIKRACISNFFI